MPLPLCTSSLFRFCCRTNIDSTTLWPDDRLRRVIDISARKKATQDITEDVVRATYQSFGPISNIYPWRSNANRNHFYVEFQYQQSCELARTTPIPGFNPVGIWHDFQHRKRLTSLSTQSSMPSNHRYSPYERSAGTSRASLPVAAQQGGLDSPQLGYQTYQQPYHSNFPYDERAKFLDNGLHTSLPEPLNMPITGQVVEFSGPDEADSSGASLLLQSTSDQGMEFSAEAPTAITTPLVLSTENTPNSRSSEISVEEMLGVLSRVRASKQETIGPDGSTHTTNHPGPLCLTPLVSPQRRHPQRAHDHPSNFKYTPNSTLDSISKAVVFLTQLPVRYPQPTARTARSFN